MSKLNNPWIVEPNTERNCQYLLFCFHFAGGNAAAFRTWSKYLANTADVLSLQLPGRLTRFNEPLINDMNILIEGVFNAIVQNIDRPFFFFGHSMGGIIAYEVIRKMKYLNLKLPEGLIVSSRVSPDVKILREKVSSLTDDEFIKKMSETYGSESGLHVLEDPDIRSMFLPIIRADMEAYENYNPILGPAFDLPIYVSYGDQDRSLSESQMMDWKKFTNKEFIIEKISGSHFFWTQNESLILDPLKKFITSIKNREKPK